MNLSLGLGIALMSGSGDIGYNFVNAEAQSFVAAMSVEPSNVRKELIDDHIGALKAAGVFNKFDRYYLLASHDEQAGRLDLKNPGSNTLIPVASPTFVADQGFSGNGTSSYLHTGGAWNALANFTLNSGSFSVWSTSSGQAASSGHGLLGADGDLVARIVPRDNANLTQIRLNSNTSATTASSDGSGQTGADRTTSGLIKFVKNGVLGGNVSSSSTSVSSANICLLKSNTVFSNLNIAACHIGAPMSSGEWTAFYNAQLAYMQAVGAA